MFPDTLTVVLVEPQNPINLGSVIRAMKNMGASMLALVNPAPMDFDRTQISAHHTAEFVRSIRIFDSLDEAIGDCRESFGFSARKRTQTWASMPVVDAASRVRYLQMQNARTAFVFGREQTGLTNDELERCTFQVHISTSDYSSMNLAQAVLVALYEVARNDNAPPDAAPLPDNHAPGSLPASLMQQRRLLEKIGNTLVGIGYYKSAAPNTAMHRLQNILNRARLHDDEINLLMGMCGETDNFARLLRRGIEPTQFRPENSLLPDPDK